LYEAPRLLAVAAGVAEADLLVVTTALTEHGQRVRRDGGAPRRPAHHRHARTERLDAPAESVGEDHVEFRHQGDGGVLDPLDRRHRVAAQADDECDRLVVVEHHGGNVRADGEAIPAVDTGFGVDRVAELAQPVDVATHRSLADPEPLRQLTTLPVTVGLQQVEQLEDASGRVRHRWHSISRRS
jgi:hypothetical protein